MHPSFSLQSAAPDAVIVFVDTYQFARGEKLHKRRVQSRMLVWCKTGKGKLKVNDSLIPLSPGRFCFLPWDCAITFMANDREPFMTGTLHLIPYHDRLEDVVYLASHDERDELFNKPGRRDLHLGCLQGIRQGSFIDTIPLHYLAEYITQWFQQKDRLEWKARFLAQLLLSELLAFFHAKPKWNQDLPLQLLQMIEYIEHHRELKIEVKELTRICDLSISAVERLFRRHLNISPLGFVNNDKINYAKFFLAGTRMQVAEVGRISGLENPYYFSKLFKKLTGMTALEYRRKSLLCNSDTVP